MAPRSSFGSSTQLATAIDELEHRLLAQIQEHLVTFEALGGVEGILILRSSNHALFQIRSPRGQLFIAEPSQIAATVTQFLFPPTIQIDDERDVDDASAGPQPPLPSTVTRLDPLLLASLQSSELFADETTAALIAITQQTHDASDVEAVELARVPPSCPSATCDERHPLSSPSQRPPCVSALVPGPRLSVVVPASAPKFKTAPLNTITRAATTTVRANPPLPTRAPPKSSNTVEASSIEDSIGSSTPAPGSSLMSLCQLAASFDHDVFGELLSFSSLSQSPSQHSLLSTGHAVAESVDFSLLSDCDSSLHHNFRGTDGLTVARVQVLPRDSTPLSTKIYQWAYDRGE